ncbi:ornithine cyclodeaminase family protein [Agrobacterium arsenijevicii]|uniref:Ornithine cyclodeaminase n=1 Tax=Agrobacterium arsenijevicii TaxID=1585697 RepID=A0ABR5DC50_9HYPH|nr:ornithine cyclodeaminase [Agrobacterium arsenijevicii]
MTTILTDQDLTGSAIMPVAIDAVETAIRQKAQGRMISPPRHHVTFPGKGDLVFTVGGVLGSAPIAGFRVYDTFNGDHHSQIVAVWSTETAKLEGIVIGEKLGAIRTGAIGGVAIRHLSDANATTVGVVGSGFQARAQLAAAAAVRRLSRVRVYSRNAKNRNAFVEEMQRHLGLDIEAVGSVAEAVRGADIVICATSSSMPVLHAQDLKPGVHINTVGPKTLGGHEIDLDVAEMAHRIATDSPEQMHAYASPFFLAGTSHEERVEDLASIISEDKTRQRSADTTTFFCSTGLAGTEVAVAAAILKLRG